MAKDFENSGGHNGDNQPSVAELMSQVSDLQDTVKQLTDTIKGLTATVESQNAEIERLKALQNGVGETAVKATEAQPAPKVDNKAKAESNKANGRKTEAGAANLDDMASTIAMDPVDPNDGMAQLQAAFGKAGRKNETQTDSDEPNWVKNSRSVKAMREAADEAEADKGPGLFTRLHDKIQSLFHKDKDNGDEGDNTIDQDTKDMANAATGSKEGFWTPVRKRIVKATAGVAILAAMVGVGAKACGNTVNNLKDSTSQSQTDNHNADKSTKNSQDKQDIDKSKATTKDSAESDKSDSTAESDKSATDTDKTAADKLGVSVEDYKSYNRAATDMGMSVEKVKQLADAHGVAANVLGTPAAQAAMQDGVLLKGNVDEPYNIETPQDAIDEMTFASYNNPAVLAMYMGAASEDSVTDDGVDGLQTPDKTVDLYRSYKQDPAVAKADFGKLRDTLRNAKAQLRQATGTMGYSMYIDGTNNLNVSYVAENNNNAGEIIVDVYANYNGVDSHWIIKAGCGQVYVPLAPVVYIPVQTPPAEQPPVQQPPVENPPVETPPTDNPPENPPTNTPPTETPPTTPPENPPTETPPTETPPTETPPTETPPTTPPETEPPTTPPTEPPTTPPTTPPTEPPTNTPKDPSKDPNVNDGNHNQTDKVPEVHDKPQERPTEAPTEKPTTAPEYVKPDGSTGNVGNQGSTTVPKPDDQNGNIGGSQPDRPPEQDW